MPAAEPSAADHNGQAGASRPLTEPSATARWVSWGTQREGGFLPSAIEPVSSIKAEPCSFSYRHCSCSLIPHQEAWTTVTSQVTPGWQGGLTEPLLSDVLRICGVYIGIRHASTQMSLTSTS